MMKQTEIDRKKKKTKQREKRYKEVNACVFINSIEFGQQHFAVQRELKQFSYIS